ncbi:MAG: hypothetical protein BWX93_00933 [Bacteroidetes bacterium ADurb.Bin139]|jgi:hypothetical protein|nr:MAG: hypothetical protein BWX93_00933 [Bacteroidetes bacterium ADurb.Bin139]
MFLDVKMRKKTQKLHALFKKAIPEDGFLMIKVTFESKNVIKRCQSDP